jgi:hypothetical protein
MPSFQLSLYILLNRDQREQLPDIISDRIKIEASKKIQKCWRNTLQYRIKFINENKDKIIFTKTPLIEYIYSNIYISLTNIIKFLHTFFQKNKEYYIEKDFLIRLNNAILNKICGDKINLVNGQVNAHDYFCAIKTLLDKPENIRIDFQTFYSIFSMFSSKHLREMIILI